VVGEEELAARAGHLFGSAREEFICAATDMATWSRPRARIAVTSEMRPVDGLAVRKLYTHAALTDDAQCRELIALAAWGASVRISPAGLPHETIIIDRRTMILAGAPVRGDRQFTVTTSPTLINGVHALFEAAWESAAALGSCLNGDLPAIEPAYRPILRALGAGLTDEAAARRIGMSLRTYRRRVAELLRLLDSDSRFQAGVRAGELGLT
jgi:DNA-binding NarL/FixJ family response regulator